MTDTVQFLESIFQYWNTFLLAQDQNPTKQQLTSFGLVFGILESN